MNQSRLNNYKEECYNVGSPRPDPVRRMSDYFPRRQSSSQTPQSSSQTSQIPKLSRKRSIRDIDTEDSPQAPKKMRPEEIDAMKTLIQEAMAGQNEKLEKLYKGWEPWKLRKGVPQYDIPLVVPPGID